MDEKVSWTIGYLAEHNLEADLADAYVHAGDLIEETDDRPFEDYGLNMNVPQGLQREILFMMEDVLPAINASLYAANVHIEKLLAYKPIQELDGAPMEKLAAILNIMTIIAEAVTDVIFQNETTLDPHEYIHGLSAAEKKHPKVRKPLQQWQSIHVKVQRDLGL